MSHPAWPRRVASLLFMSLVAIIGSPILEAATINFTNATPIALPSGDVGVMNPYPSPILVSGLSGLIRRVSVTLHQVSHTFPDDLDVLLVGPTDAKMVIMSDVGGTFDLAGVTFTISDRGATLLPDNAQIAAGTYRPSNVGASDPFAAPAPASPYAEPAPAGAATFASAFGGTNPNGLWRLYVVDDAGQDLGTFAGGWTLGITMGAGHVDFDGDFKTDDSVIRIAPSSFTWFANNGAGFSAIVWGNPTIHAWAFTGDYDGDSKSDQAVWAEATGVFSVRQSSNGALLSQQWGQAGDMPLVAGDFDGDTRTDFAVWRPTTGFWWIRRSSNGALQGQAFGVSGDVPVTGDYDGDGRADLAIRRPGGGLSTFHILKSNGSVYQVVQWGLDTDQAAPGDYDGDGITDIAVIRRTTTSTTYLIRRSTDGALLARTWRTISGDYTVPGDYDGDEITDVALHRAFTPPGQKAFFILLSSDGVLNVRPWGIAGDYPVAAWIVR